MLERSRSENEGGAPSDLDNSHLAGHGSTGPDRPGRIWTGWFTPRLPVHLLERDVVVDSNGVSERRIDLLGGGTRTWKLRPRTPSAAKQAQLQGYYQDLQDSIGKHGFLTPILVWRAPDHKFYLRYGASRVLVANRMGLETIPAIVCDYSAPPGNAATPCNSPLEVMMAFGPPASVGWLEVSHERIDAHHLEPRYPSA